MVGGEEGRCAVLVDTPLGLLVTTAVQNPPMATLALKEIPLSHYSLTYYMMRNQPVIISIVTPRPHKTGSITWDGGGKSWTTNPVSSTLS